MTVDCRYLPIAAIRPIHLPLPATVQPRVGLYDGQVALGNIQPREGWDELLLREIEWQQELGNGIPS